MKGKKKREQNQYNVSELMSGQPWGKWATEGSFAPVLHADLMKRVHRFELVK